jgi:hypothetical protein
MKKVYVAGFFLLMLLNLVFAAFFAFFVQIDRMVSFQADSFFYQCKEATVIWILLACVFLNLSCLFFIVLKNKTLSRYYAIYVVLAPVVSGVLISLLATILFDGHDIFYGLGFFKPEEIFGSL